MRNIDLWTIVVCLAGDLYTYKYCPRDDAGLQIALSAINQQPKPVAPPPGPSKPAPVVAAQPEYQPTPAPVPEPPKQVGSTDPWTAELARQTDARIVHQRGEQTVQDQRTVQIQVAQASAAVSTCAAWRNEKEVAVASLRHGGDAQWVNFWNRHLHAATDTLYRDHC